MKVIPQGYRMFVRLNEVKEFTREFKRDDGTTGTIIIPDKHAELARIGVVVDIGDKVTGWGKGDMFICDFTAGSSVDSVHLEDLEPHQDTLRMIVKEDIWARLEGVDERKMGILKDADRVVINED